MTKPEHAKEFWSAVLVSLTIVGLTWLVGGILAFVAYDVISDYFSFSFWAMNPTIILLAIALLAIVLLFLVICSYNWYIWLLNFYYKMFRKSQLKRESRVDLETIKQQFWEKYKALQNDYDKIAKEKTFLHKENKKLRGLLAGRDRFLGEAPTE